MAPSGPTHSAHDALKAGADAAASGGVAFTFASCAVFTQARARVSLRSGWMSRTNGAASRAVCGGGGGKERVGDPPPPFKHQSNRHPTTLRTLAAAVNTTTPKSVGRDAPGLDRARHAQSRRGTRPSSAEANDASWRA